MSSQLLQNLCGECQRLEEDAEYSKKGHFVMGDTWRRMHLSFGLSAAVSGAIASAMAFSSFSYHDVVAGIVALLAVGFATTITFLNPSKISCAHLEAGNDYAELQNDARIFRTITCSVESDPEILTSTLRTLAERRDQLNHTHPQISDRAFRKARSKIEEGETQYRVDQRG